MRVEIIGVFIPIIFLIGGVIVIIYLRKYANQERMAMIEKGVDPSVFAAKNRNDSGALRASLLLIGAGVGLLLGYFMDRQFYMEEVAYFSMLFICGGLGLGTAYLIEEKKRKKDEGV
jgi:hypothetical protein